MASNYSPVSRQEEIRLRQQAHLTHPLDKQLIASALAHKPEIVIDLGCAQGHMTAELLYGLPGISETIGVDKQEEALKPARSRKATKPGLSFKCIDLEGPQLQKEIIELASGRKALVMLASVLLHLGDPVGVLSSLNKSLPAGSQPCARSTDDSSVVSYPEEPMTQAVKLTSKAPGASDRYYGRKLYNHFSQAGLSDIRPFSSALLSSNLSEQDKSILFEARIAWRAMGYKNAKELSGPEKRDFTEIQEALRKIRPQSENAEFFYSETFYGAVATTCR